MLIKAKKEQIFERKADSQGRVSLPTSKYAEKKLELVVINQNKEET